MRCAADGLRANDVDENIQKALDADPPTWAIWATPPEPPPSSGGIKKLSDDLFASVRAFVDRRVDKSHTELIEAMIKLNDAIEKHAQPENTQHQLDRHMQHLQRLETRLQKVERKTP